MILNYALDFAFLCFGLGLAMNLYRVFRAPGVTDRILALDTMVINVLTLKSGINFEAALLFAMTGFVSTVAYCKFILRGDIIE